MCSPFHFFCDHQMQAIIWVNNPSLYYSTNPSPPYAVHIIVQTAFLPIIVYACCNPYHPNSWFSRVMWFVRLVISKQGWFQKMVSFFCSDLVRMLAITAFSCRCKRCKPSSASLILSVTRDSIIRSLFAAEGNQRSTIHWNAINMRLTQHIKAGTPQNCSHKFHPQVVETSGLLQTLIAMLYTLASLFISVKNLGWNGQFHTYRGSLYGKYIYMSSVPYQTTYFPLFLASDSFRLRSLFCSVFMSSWILNSYTKLCKDVSTHNSQTLLQ